MAQIPTVVVTTSTLVTHPPWPETPPLVKRPVSSPPGEPVSSGVPSTSLPPTNNRFRSELERDRALLVGVFESESAIIQLQDGGGFHIQAHLYNLLYASVFTAQSSLRS